MSEDKEMLTKEEKEEKDFIKQKNDLLDLINDGYVNVPMFNHVFGNLYDEDEINDQLSFCTEYIFTQDFKYDDDTPIIDMIKNAIKKAIEIKKANKSMCSVMFKKHKSTRKYKYKNKKRSQKKSGVQKKKSLRKSSTKKSLSKTKKSLKKSKVAKSLKKSLKKKL